MSDPWIIRKNGTVEDRESGAVVGRVKREYSPWLTEKPWYKGFSAEQAHRVTRKTRREAAQVLWRIWLDRRTGDE